MLEGGGGSGGGKGSGGSGWVHPGRKRSPTRAADGQKEDACRQKGKQRSAHRGRREVSCGARRCCYCQGYNRIHKIDYSARSGRPRSFNTLVRLRTYRCRGPDGCA